MNFDFDPETREMREMVVGFARRELNGGAGFRPGPGGGTDEAAADFRHRWQLAGKQGITGSCVPAAYGGSGLDAVTAAALMEALGQGCTDTGFAFSVGAHLFASLMPLVEFGTEEQKRRWLPALCSGERIAAHGITEPEAGSDALNLRTRAERREDGYVLNGGKCFTTNAPVADVFVVQAATAPGGGYFGLTAFIVEAGTPGLTVGPPYDKTGLHGSPMADVHFEDCHVPLDQVLGGEGAGASVFTSSMKWERTCLFAAYLGTMKRVLDGTLAYVGEREQFGVPIGSNQAVSHRIVDMTLRYESARLMLYKAARGLADGSDDEIAPPSPARGERGRLQLGLDAVQLHGALGILTGEAEALVRDAMPSRIFSGTNEIQKNNIARALGLGARRSRPRPRSRAAR
uniref:Putative L-prolyl-PCP dehydrogenase n=1 Tax=Streptomyces griseoviridis TaxID=45398 RepID=B6VRQ1_STRGD|nr:putative L-prolyl-PCP dehydrogenase [Streptomyces griseoviridis]